MLVERVAFAADGTPVEYAHDRHRGDRARFVIHVAPEDLLARDHRPAARRVDQGG
jgi:hypothetical protein